jgi:hypothetical protein
MTSSWLTRSIAYHAVAINIAYKFLMKDKYNQQVVPLSLHFKVTTYTLVVRVKGALDQ